MGRKPNQLILEFFERGAKLEDSSNRYQHTCRSCGEKFPKGRIDSLTNHLVKKCPAISLRDRQKALLQLNDLPDINDARNQVNQASVELPAGNQRWTALETLAEVSRQIDLSEKHDDRTQHNNSAPPRVEEPPRMDRFELQEQWTPDNPPLSYEARVQRDKKLLSQKIAPRRESESAVPPADITNNNTNEIPVTVSPPQAPINMASATELEATATEASRFTSMVDPQLFNEGLPQELSQSLVSDINSLKDATFDGQYLPQRGVDQPQPTWPMLDGSGGNMYPDPEPFESHVEQPKIQQQPFQRPLAINTGGMTTEFSAEFGNGTRSNKPKVRGRFTPDRRKEVQAVRKRGACIRCRMLKKPCSGETPCATCRNVESARLWKQPCMRTRLADELDMYSAGLHAVLAYHEVNAIKSRLNFQPSANRIEASHYPETEIFANFSAQEGQDIPSEKNIDPILGLTLDFTGESLRVLDNDTDDLTLKIENYVERMAPTFFEKEPSHFMNVTLALAMQLSIEKEDTLLKRALELWGTVHILVDHELKWSISERSPLVEETMTTTPIESQTTTYQLLCMQLAAAVEKKAAQTSKAVLNDLERRLLQRTSTSSFETFLVAIILLNCVEKSTWLFKSWEQDYLKARWPLDKTPIWYGSQGDRITDMLQMLLRMRSICPKTYARMGDGILAAEESEVVAGWFEKIQLSREYLL